jgi:hypothetical protein
MAFLILSFKERRLIGKFSVILMVRRRKNITSSRGFRRKKHYIFQDVQIPVTTVPAEAPAPSLERGCLITQLGLYCAVWLHCTA